MKRNSTVAVKLAAVPTSNDQISSARPENAVEIYSTYIVAMNEGIPNVQLFGVERRATIGVLLPALVVGDCVAVALSKIEASVTVLGILVPNPANPIKNRAIKLESNQAITLQTGNIANVQPLQTKVGNLRFGFRQCQQTLGLCP